MQTKEQAEVHAAPGTGRGPRISIFLPGSSVESDLGQNAMRLKNLLREAERKLIERGGALDAIRELIEPIYALADRPSLWRHETKGLAVFRAANFLRYHLAPAGLPEMVVVDDHFCLGPVSSVVESGDRPFLLALRPDGARLFETTAEALEKTLDVLLPAHSSEAVDATGSFRRRLRMFRRREISPENQKRAPLSYFTTLDQALRTRLDTERTPVVLAGMPGMCQMFRTFSRFSHRVAGEIHDSSHALTTEELWWRCWEFASENFQAARQRTMDEYLQRWHTQLASNDIRDIEAAACRGRIETLFLSVLSGVSPKEQAGRTQDRGEQELLNRAALHTFLSGGTIYAVAPDLVPGRGPAAAVFRS